MAQYNSTGVQGYTASAAVALYLRVYISAAHTATLAGADNIGIGTVEEPAFAANDPCSVRLWTAPGTQKMVANGAITAGSSVYAAAGGKIASSGAICIGEAKEAASADNDVIEVLPLIAAPGTTRSVRTRFTIAQVNAGATLLTAVPGMRYRMVSASAIAVGGAVGATTTVDILGTQSASGVKLVAFAQANLTQNTQLTSGGTGAAILAGGLSYVLNDAGTAITVGVTGSAITTATHVDVIMTYVQE
jgi:hypothetical protein